MTSLQGYVNVEYKSLDKDIKIVLRLLRSGSAPTVPSGRGLVRPLAR